MKNDKSLLELDNLKVQGQLSPEDVTEIIKAADSLWLYQEGGPHAKLTSGACSDGFVNLRTVICRTNLCDVFAFVLVKKLWEVYDGQVDFVVGSDTASLNLAYAVACILNAQTYPMHKVAIEKDGIKVEMQTYTGPKIPPGAKVLQVEELMTTAKTFRLVRDGINKACPGVDFIPFLPLIVDRRAEGELLNSTVDDVTLLSLVQYRIKAWTENCPLCAQGSEAIRPNTPEGWAKLTGKNK
jgi:orotate phosphoribosyltransferase